MIPTWRERITQEYLKNILHYDPRTGIFTWRVKKAIRTIVGSIAGTPNSDGYICIMIDRRLYRAHRLAWLYMTGRWPEIEADHKNRVRHDNRFSNLREATRLTSAQNKSKHANNTSGFTGVCWHKKTGKWAAQIGCGWKHYHLGLFDSRESARNAYVEAKKLFHTFQPEVA